MRPLLSPPLTNSSRLRADLLWAVVIGCMGALAAYGFRRATGLTHFLLTGHTTSLTQTAAAMGVWQRVLTPLAGAFLAGLVLYFGSRLHVGRSATEYIEAIRAGHGEVPARPSMVRALSSMLSIASGASIGREGPLVQLAAMLGSVPGKWLNWDAKRRRLMIACGAAAGIASAYNAPIAGALFVAEIVLGSIATASSGPLLIASMAATLVTRDLLGEQPIFGAHELIGTSSQGLGLTYTLRWRAELLGYLAVGVSAGFASPLFLLCIKSAQRAFGLFRTPIYLKLAIGGLIVGLLSAIDPRVWGNGYSTVNSLLHENWMPAALLGILALKVIATAASVGSGAIGGIFTPTLFVGAVLGELVGCGIITLFPQRVESPAAYGLAGMAALLAGTTHAPLMAILMVFEMTLDYQLVLPLMLASVISYAISVTLLTIPVYGQAVESG